MVAWDSKAHRAVITVVDEDGLRDLRDSTNQELTFSSELDAHRYLNGLWLEEHGEDDTWKTLI